MKSSHCKVYSDEYPRLYGSILHFGFVEWICDTVISSSIRCIYLSAIMHMYVCEYVYMSMYVYACVTERICSVVYAGIGSVHVFF